MPDTDSLPDASVPTSSNAALVILGKLPFCAQAQQPFCLPARKKLTVEQLQGAVQEHAL